MQLSKQQILKFYNEFPILYEIKEIIESLSIECRIKEFLNYNGNSIIHNKSLNNFRGNEKYNPPYGWIGIGLDIHYNYNNFNSENWLDSNNKKWAIAYYGLGDKLTSNQIKEQLIKIITKNDIKPDKYQIKCESKDIRHPGKKIGKGIYLTSDINIAEKYSGIISFYFKKNNKKYIKKYKIALKMKVYTDNIREPEDIKYWILNKEDIRIYKILLKEIV